MSKQLTRQDLPSKKNRGTNSLKLPVLYQGTLRYVCDIHFGDETLCYLEDCEGVPTKISELILLTKEEARLFIGLEQGRDSLYGVFETAYEYEMNIAKNKNSTI